MLSFGYGGKNPADVFRNETISKTLVQHLIKTKDILIFVFAFIIISALAYMIFLFCYVQKRYAESPNEKTETYTTSKQTETVDPKIAILINTEHNDWLRIKYGFKSWNPTGSDLNLVEKILDKAIEDKEFDFLKCPIKKNFENYYRQYVPYINKNGERIIEINAFCEILKIPPNPENGITEWTEMDWKNEYVMVSDGGNCYWQITINIDTKEFNNLMVNGIA